MASRYQAPRGTFDVLPEQAPRRRRLEATAGALFARAGYAQIVTPNFEQTDLFERGVGRSTDVVQKEMFTFSDKGERMLTLRPEGTAPICRAYLEHGMYKRPQPVKLYYAGPFFRHERPQAGRYRQFHQLGLECVGTDSPLADAEAILLLAELLEAAAVPGVELRIGSLGSLEARAGYLEELRSFLEGREDRLSETVRERFRINPLRAFDAKDDATREVMAEAPTLLEALSPDDAAHFEEVQRLLRGAGVEFTIDPSLVRGLDYYTRTIFSFVCDRLGAQSEIGGGGRYDGLIEQLGGPATPAVGWAAGIERILLAQEEAGEVASLDAFVAIADPGERERAMALAVELRQAGFSAEIDLAERGMKGQLKHAGRLGARRVVILEAGGGAQLREMGTGEQRPVDPGNLLAEMELEIR